MVYLAQRPLFPNHRLHAAQVDDPRPGFVARRPDLRADRPFHLLGSVPGCLVFGPRLIPVIQDAVPDLLRESNVGEDSALVERPHIDLDGEHRVRSGPPWLGLRPLMVRDPDDLAAFSVELVEQLAQRAKMDDRQHLRTSLEQ
ncbi:MAG: hypothetical protein DCC55_28455 [Chloroflexi bacterium]|nr:MAG: hypothetical protein DCC55_28455 [Chloroflexota bacterium]